MASTTTSALKGDSEDIALFSWHTQPTTSLQGGRQRGRDDHEVPFSSGVVLTLPILFETRPGRGPFENNHGRPQRSGKEDSKRVDMGEKRTTITTYLFKVEISVSEPAGGSTALESNPSRMVELSFCWVRRGVKEVMKE